MRILSITAQKPNSTGSGVYLTELVKEYALLSHEQAVVAGVYREDEVELPDGVDFYPVYFCEEGLPYPIVGMSDEMPYISTKYSEMSPEMVEQFRSSFMSVIERAVEELQPDLILCHHLYLLTALVREHFPERKVYGFCHNTDLRQMQKTDLEREFIRREIGKLDHIFVPQRAQEEGVLALYPVDKEKITRVGMGYNNQIFHLAEGSRDKEGVTSLVFAGKIAEKKGVMSLLRAMALLGDEKELDMRKNRKNNSHTYRKRICIMAVLLAGSLMLGGCGVKKEKAADNELPEIVIGMDYFEPYSYQVSNGEYKGIDVELAKEAFQRLGYQPKFENIVWEDKDELLAEGTIDCLWSCYSMNGREDKYQWAGPYLYSRQMVAVRKESEINTIQDLEGKRIAVQATTKAEDLFLHKIASDLPQMESVNCFSTTNELYAALRKDYVDAIAGHEAMLGSLVRDGEDAYRMLDESIYTSELGIAFKKGTHKEVAQELTETLEEMRNEGITEEIVKKYGLDADEILPGGKSK